MFYNVENLFDTADDSLTRDEEFTPEGDKHWTGYRYFDKLTKIAKVVLNLGGWEPPALIGLCEIENRKVLEDLVSITPLKKFNYQIIHRDSPDARGIDVALIYQPEIYTPFQNRWLTVSFPFDTTLTTREILYSAGTIGSDTLHLFVNHWPSRRGGQAVSEPKRAIAAERVKMVVDSIFQKNRYAAIIITGDFNDGPEDISVSQHLGAMAHADFKPATLYNAMHNLKFKKGLGTHKYREEWNTLDQFIFSASMLDPKAPIHILPEDVHILEAPWLMEDDPFNPGEKPLRTYAGPKYLGGYSDHLPIYLDMTFTR